MRFGKRKLMALAGFLIAVVAAGVAWWLWETTGLLVVLLAASVLGSLASLWFAAQAERRVARLVGAVQRDVNAIRQAEVSRFARIEKGIERVHGAVTRPSEHAEQLLNAVHAGFTRIEIQNEKYIEEARSEMEQALTRATEALDRLQLENSAQAEQLAEAVSGIGDEVWKLFQQLESLGGLYWAAKPECPLPSTRDWAASPDLLLFLYTTVRKLQPELVVECGSGVSTLVIADALRANGSGRLVSLEHLPEFRQQTMEWVAERDLESWVEVRLAPLSKVRIAGEMWPWYTLDQVPEGPIDLLLVDGPPGSTRPQARYPALPVLADRLSDGAMVVMDDANRADENSVTEKWASLFPDWQLLELPHEKGTIAFKKVSVVSRPTESETSDGADTG